jgi:hypothetical protein
MPQRVVPVLVATAVLLLACLLGPARAVASWTWPVRGDVLTPYRNGGDPYAAGQHRGVDLAAPVGTQVVAAAAGTVRFAGVAGSSGLTVSIRTADGLWDTSYLHLATATVRQSERVSTGDRVGTVGTSGRRSVSQPHLHFGVRQAGSRHAYRDPLDFLPSFARVPDSPRAAPVPVRSPVRTAPSPVPVGRRAPGRAPARAPAPRPLRAPLPAGRGIRVPAGRGVRVPGVRVPGGGRLPARAPSPVALRPHDRPARAPHAVGTGHAVPEPRMGPHGVATPGARRSDPARPGGRPAPASGGPDLGWALACVGLLAAAACIGLGKGDGRGKGARSTMGAVVRSLAGGRPGGS